MVVLMRARSGPHAAARRAALLFAVAGALSIVNAWIPGVAPAEARVPFTLLGLLDLAAALLVLSLPWRAWPPRALLAIPALALALVDVFAIVGELEPWRYSVFLVVLAVWIGASLPRWTTVKLAPAIGIAYVLPLLVSGQGAEAGGSVGLVVPVVVVIGELVAHVVDGLRTANRALTDASQRDELTGVGNRRLATSVLARLRPGDAVLVLDLDHFKQVNDRYGHAAGDEVLVALGALLQRTMRGADAVARLGGEEFLVVLRGGGSDAGAVAERIRADWRPAAPRPTTLSIGVALHEFGEAPQAVLVRADAALYEAKHSGRDRVCHAAAPAVAAR